jgi:hypothetical protein
MDLEWETGTARTRSQPRHAISEDAGSRLDPGAGPRRVSGPLQAGRFSDPAAIEVDEDAPWFAALPPSLLAPADAPTPAEFEEPAEAAERTRQANRAVVARELSALATPGPGSAPRPGGAPRRPGRMSPAGEEWAPVYDPVTGRRTVTIRGRGAERAAPIAPSSARRARPTAPRHERSGFVADRAAMWAVLLGVLLVLIAVASAHG